MIDAASFQGHVYPPIVFKTLPPKKLATAPDVFNVRKAIIVLKRSFSERRSSNAELRLLGQFAHNMSKVFTSERNIGIEIAYDVGVQILHLGHNRH